MSSLENLGIGTVVFFTVKGVISSTFIGDAVCRSLSPHWRALQQKPTSVGRMACWAEKHRHAAMLNARMLCPVCVIKSMKYAHLTVKAISPIRAR
jgi:hypothetical protein